ncbi:MAG: DNA polymerase IV [Planctomycetes bacterium]|nr:DNA polymerase IV [Planctomycetota bacterium]
MTTDPTILHVDMDAFYASVEQRDRPELRGKPVIVGGVKGRGVVSAASYEARKFGVHSAMPISTARRLCPQGIYLPVRMSHYAAISRQIRSIFLSFTPLVEPLSLDEAFLDVRGCEGLFGSVPDIARQIKQRIRAETGLIASVGVAPNKYLAKLASDVGKPDGYIVLLPEKVGEFLSPLPVSRIWGVGAKSEKRLHDIGIRTIGQIAAMPERLLSDRFGEMGRHIWQLANGQDDRTVVPDREAKSVSTETTFAQDIGDRAILRVWLLELVDHLASRLRHEQIWARTIDLKIRSSDFRTVTRSTTLAEPTNVTNVIWKAAADLFERSLTSDLMPVRLLGVGATKLTREPIVQGNLFEQNQHPQQAALDQTIDTIRAQFGTGSIGRGILLNRRPGENEDQQFE